MTHRANIPLMARCSSAGPARQSLPSISHSISLLVIQALWLNNSSSDLALQTVYAQSHPFRCLNVSNI